MKTVRVRIRVVVAADGWWSSFGWGGPDGGEMEEIGEEFDEKAMRMIPEDCPQQFGWHWIEADVPIPEETLVEGSLIGNQSPTRI